MIRIDEGVDEKTGARIGQKTNENTGERSDSQAQGAQGAQRFHLQTRHTSYIFMVDDYEKLNHLYYGPRLEDESLEALQLHPIKELGSQVLYRKGDGLSSQDQRLLEFSEPQTGDYRVSGCDIRVGKRQATDFRYVGFALGISPPEGLPRGHGADAEDQLAITLEDRVTGIDCVLYYTVFPEADVIMRTVEVVNSSEETCLLAALAITLDMMNRNFELTDFHGGWAREASMQRRPLAVGRTAIASLTGASSNQHNPGFFLSEKGADEERGLVYGGNLIYSGNHKTMIERTPHELIRVTSGINDETFSWPLAPGERFASPSLALTCGTGFNGASGNFHRFVNHHIVPPYWDGRERPVLFNHWEGTFFDYNEAKLVKLAREARDLGAELFVLDDGWFKNRNNDLAGLSNYEVDRQKFPRGLAHFFAKLKGMGLECGIWVEPEMISVDSDLYRAHPDYALGYALGGGRDLRFGRNQLVLDLTKPEVREYIVEQVSGLIDTYDISYVKWDMNRHISDVGEAGSLEDRSFHHRYILGLYEVLGRIFGPKPHVLLETCSSGGNRFDLGMLSYGPQIWSSDNTDPISRLEIQGGLSYLYPPSTMGAHVAGGASQQTLRQSPLSTRFNVAAFGVLGYEMDLANLTAIEKKEIEAQIFWYKAHRSTLQFGTFRRQNRERLNLYTWQVGSAKETIVGKFQTLAEAAPPQDRLQVLGLSPQARYRVVARPQRVMIERFGELVKHVFPRKINPNGLIFHTAAKHYALQDQTQEVEASGTLLDYGLWLHSQFLGTGYDPGLRLWGDFGSTLYLVTPLTPLGGEGIGKNP